MSTTIRVNESTRARFSQLSATTGRPMTELLDEAVDALERRLFFDQLTSGYDDLRADAAAWAEVEDERTIEAGAAADRSA